MTERSQPEFLRSVRMSSLTALISLRRYLRDHPEASPEAANTALLRVDADYSRSDFATGLKLHEELESSIDFLELQPNLREALQMLIRLHNPWWRRLAPYGRQRLATALSKDELQTFRSAGLMEQPPSALVVEWWDKLAAEARTIVDENLNIQGRYAEQLSLAYERARLESLGIDQQPKWIAIEDNGAGFDILSFDPSAYGVRNRLIEVKSTQRNETRLILTRGEWETALEFGEAYHFYIWKLPAEVLIIKRVSDISLHVPVNVVGGKWLEAEIILPDDF